MIELERIIEPVRDGLVVEPHHKSIADAEAEAIATGRFTLVRRMPKDTAARRYASPATSSPP